MDNNMSDNDDNPIDRSLGIGPLAPIDYSQTISTIIGQAANDSAKEDFTFSRSNIREVVENGTEAITKLALIAEQSQNPRAFEVLAKLMDTVVNASDKLVALQKTMGDIEKIHDPHGEEAKKHITNQLFVGSTAELAALIAGNKPELNQ
jgi:hypothetical protein